MLLPLALLDASGRATRIEAANSTSADTNETDGAEVGRAHSGNGLRSDVRCTALRVKRTEREVAASVEDVVGGLLVVVLLGRPANLEATLLLVGEEAVVPAHVLDERTVEHLMGLLLIHRLNLVEGGIGEKRVLVGGLVPFALAHLDDGIHVRRSITNRRDTTLRGLDTFAVARELGFGQSHAVRRDVGRTVIRLDDGQILQKRIRLVHEIHHVAVKLLARLVHSGGNVPQRESTLVDNHDVFSSFLLSPELHAVR